MENPAAIYQAKNKRGEGPLDLPIYGIEQIEANEKKRRSAALLQTERFEFNGKGSGKLVRDIRYPEKLDLKKDNLLVCGDNVEVMQRLLEMNGGKPFIDLIYIDPPFCSNRNYNTETSVSGFGDKWSDGLKSYLPWLMERVRLMKGLLKGNGQFCLHLDWHAVHYVKAELDKVFGMDNFRNEIIWCYSGGGTPKKDFPRKHDTILRYSASESFTFNVEYKPYKENTQQVGKHSTYVAAENQEIDLKRGTPVTDWWTDVNTVTGWNPEKLGYPTQKPEALVSRLIKACTKPGDLIADFYMGSGTTCASAQSLGRRWLGVDQNSQAVEVAADRLRKMERTSFSYSKLQANHYFRDDVEALSDKRSGSSSTSTGARLESLSEFKRFILDNYLNPRRGDRIGNDSVHGYLQTSKGMHAVFVGSNSEPVTRSDLKRFLSAIKNDPSDPKFADVLGWDFEPALKLDIQKIADEEGLEIQLKKIENVCLLSGEFVA